MALISYNQLKEVLTDFKTKIQAKFVENITFDDSIDVATNKSKNTLKQTKNNQETVVINHVVEDWGDLEHTKYAKIQNIFDKNTQVIDGKKYVIVTNGVGQLHADPDWKVGRIPCKANDTFTVVKGSKHDSIQMGVYNSNDVWIHGLTTPQTPIKGRMVYKVTIPSNLADASYFVFNMHNQSITPDEVMVFKGHLTDDQIPKEYYPNLGNYTAVIDGDKVAIEFNKDSTSLQSNTVVEAIKELANRANTSGGGTVKSVNGKRPDPQGEVTVEIADISTLQQTLNDKIATGDVTVQSVADKVVRLDNTGKLHNSIIPNLAITDVFVVANETAMMQQNVQVGDVVVVENEGNKTYMCKDPSQTDKDQKFIAINMGTPMVMKVNNQSPNSVGEVTVHGNQISAYDGVSAKSVQGHLTDLRTTVNNHSTRISALESKKPTVHVGEIITTFKDNGDSYNLNGVTYLYCGKAQVITRANYAQLMDALGLAGVQRSELPVISDQTIQYDLGQRRAVRKHYIVAKM